MREFKKATDDIKKEINNSSSGVMNDLNEIKKDIKDTTKSVNNNLQG